MNLPQPTFTQQPPIGKPWFTIVMLEATGAAAVAAAKAAEPPPNPNFNLRPAMSQELGGTNR